MKKKVTFVSVRILNNYFLAFVLNNKNLLLTRFNWYLYGFELQNKFKIFKNRKFQSSKLKAMTHDTLKSISDNDDEK